MKACLYEREAYPWYLSDDTYFHGYFMYEGKKYTGVEACKLIRMKIDGEVDLSFFNKLSGVFGFIFNNQGRVVFGVDRLRGLPLFYSVIDNEIYVGDNSYDIVSSLKKVTLNRLSVSDYISSTTLVTGDRTLINELMQVEAAQIVTYIVSEDKILKERYFKSSHGDFWSDDNLQSEFYNAYEATKKELVMALDGRTAVIPLSGGADSRMILELLVQARYPKIICYTYGTENNPESLISKHIAEKYNCKWVMVPYSAQMWEQLRDDVEAKQYEMYAFQYSASPHYQDYIAVRYLKVKGIVPKDCVFVPGHSGDVPNGNHVASVYLKANVSKEECIRSMLNYQYLSWNNELKEKIASSYAVPMNASPQEFASIEEWFDTSERQAKYIVNSVRIYEFFGFEWLIPLWDNNQFEFWRRVPLSWRYKRKLYYKIVNDKEKSTNDVTTKDVFEAKIRNVPIFRSFARRVRRVQRWWNSPLQIEHKVSAFTYFSTCVFGNPLFSINYIVSRKYVRELEKHYDYDK